MDFLNDSNPTYLYHYADEVGELPEYMAKSAALTRDDLVDLAPQAFADPARREFPIHSKEAAFMSALFYHSHPELKNPVLEKRIEKAAKVLGVHDDYKRIVGVFAEQEKKASTSVRHALTILKDSESIELYPVTTAYDVVESARGLAKDASENRIPVDFARQAASVIMERAAELGVEDRIVPYVKKAGANNVPDYNRAMLVANNRIYCGVGEEGVEIYKDIVKMASEDEDNLEDYIHLFREQDDFHGVKYSDIVPDPYSAFYSGPSLESIVKASHEVVFISNVAVPVDSFLAETDDRIQQNFSKQASDVILEAKALCMEDPAKAASMIDNLSEPVQKKLLGLLYDSAISTAAV